MRVLLVCLLTASIWASSSWAKEDKGGSIWAPPLPDVSKIYKPDEWKNHKWEIPGAKEHKKKDFELPQDYEIPPIDTVDPQEYGPRKFGSWWFSSRDAGRNCDLQQVAEGWNTIFLAFEPYVTYMVPAATPNVLSFYVPSQPHPKGIPVAFVDSKSFSLAPQSAKTFVPPDAKAQNDMLQAMKLGKAMIVKWIDGDGARREDRYSLMGFSEAFAELSRRQCPSSGS